MKRQRKIRRRQAQQRAPRPSSNRMVVDPAARAMEHAQPWTSLSQLVGVTMPVQQILRTIEGFSREEGLFTLCLIAADLANADGGVKGAEARAWTRDLLVQRIGSADPMEDAVSRAAKNLDSDAAIAHAFVVFLLQTALLHRGATDARRPSDGQLAFLMLALNDYLPDWVEESPSLSQQEEVLGTMFFSSVFNQSFADPLRFVLRATDILSGDVKGSPISDEEWLSIQLEAFGCPFGEYAERFLIPLFLLSKTWGTGRDTPVLAPSAWVKGDEAQLYERWFREASAGVEEAASWPSRTGLTAGLPNLPREFFRTPLIRVQDRVICLSPWHVRDHASFGTWAKLNTAAKKVLNTGSNQRFMSTFGVLFERWCAGLANEAARQPRFKDKVLTPSSPGADDEIEDVVLVHRDRVALFSAKASLVPEDNLKTANSVEAIVRWLRRFFFADAAAAKATGHRAGALWLLDQKVTKIRSGDYSERGIHKNALVIPVVVCFDNVGESGVLYKWLEEECHRLGILSARPRVRPVTVLTPETYEALLALGRSGIPVCDRLMAKTRSGEKWGRTDWFVSRQEKDALKLRMPAMAERFSTLTARSIERLRAAGIFED